MATPNGGLITETDAQYYAGTQVFIAQNNQSIFTSTFNTNLTFGSNDPTAASYNTNNFRLYTSATGNNGTFTEYILAYTVFENVITTTTTIADGTYVVIQLLTKDGGNFGNKDAFGSEVQDNYASYSYISIGDLVITF